MVVPTNPPESRRASLLTRLVRGIDGGLIRRFTSEPTSLPATTAPALWSSTEGNVERHPVPPESALYLEARRQIKRRAWGHAQRALEAAATREDSEAARLDLAALRLVRRSLRRTCRWPSDVDAHLDLGRGYFELDLGDEALAEFTFAQRLAPGRYEPFLLAALEYLYRGEYASAMSAWTSASALKPELGPFDEVLASIPMT
jgi:tetratricopeptide (TPR) repeat protein